ncbi:DNA polymerase III subunit delta [Candidatus Phytoplasma oryzae]|nr:DNA polymerase III subunit delta [Candidatus Phytoplasma oryzae]
MKIYHLNLFFYQQSFFLEKKKKILKKFCKEKNYYFISYKIEKDNYKNIFLNIEKELCTNSFFFNKKIIFIENISLLFSEYKNNKKNISFLLNYFQNVRKEIYIYFAEEKDIFPKDIKKILTKYFFIQKTKSMTKKELISYISNIFAEDKFIIKNKIIYKIIERTYGDLLMLNQEIIKIKTYYNNSPNKIINDEKIIEKLIYSENKDIFLLINSILKKNMLIDNFLLFKKKIINQKQNSSLIINKILKKLKDLIIIKNFIKEKKKKEKIAYILKYSVNEIDFMIKEANNLDINKMNNLFLFFSKIFYKEKKYKNNLEMFFLMEMINNEFL